MSYEKKDFKKILGIDGLSDEILADHFTLYEGYVKNASKLTEQLSSLDSSSVEYAELKRRFGWEWNGMRLHELYFENLTREANNLDKDSDLARKINDNFGSYEKWEKDFKSTGMMRGIGWIILYYDRENDKLFNSWINEHDLGHLSGATPLLVMDVFEHAFLKDYGLKKADYINTFMKNIDWGVAKDRQS